MAEAVHVPAKRICEKQTSKKLHLSETALGMIFIILGGIMMANPFVKTKTTILFDGWVLMVNGAADFIFYFLLKRGLKAAAEKQEQESEENTEKTEEIKETAEEIPEWREDSYRENKVPDTVTEMTLTETPEKTERNAYEEEEREKAQKEEPQEEILEEWKD